MVIRCSLLGHDYGESEVEREREERGSEVVVTLREVQECARCGNTTVVSENKEVTSIEPPEPDPEPVDTELVGNDEVTTGGVESTFDGADDDGFENATPQDPEHDDGMILDEEETEEKPADRQYGQWPEPEEVPDPEEGEGPRAWPDVEGEDEGFDAQVSGEDEGAANVSLGGGLTPEAADDVETEDDAEFIESVDAAGQFDAAAPTDDEVVAGAGTDGTDGADDAPNGITSAPASGGPTPSSDEPGEFVCPRCDFVRNAAGSSLRAGDICPECRRGYLAEQDA